ncbi:MAG TPA: DUF455 family protein [Kofleriaceae bacterium]|jgi:uncharacterized ferritin-like protein (DUF455 family)|nr:DUF455 family protein [Kofleriaceae bacterium]
MGLDPNTPVGARRRTIASYLYCYARTLELACAWTMNVPNTAFKVALGRKIGLDGLALERLGRRIAQMFSTGSNGAAPTAFAQWLDAHHAETDEGRISAVLLAVIDALSRSMTRYLANAHPGDEPTLLLLRSLQADLALGRETLAPFATTTFEAPAPDAEGARVDYAGTEPLLPIPSFPARPETAVLDPNTSRPRGLSIQEAMQPENVAAQFRRMYIEIEISAIEVCARNVVEFRTMPNAFKVDMSQQIWDEARHAELAVAVVTGYGFELGVLHYSGLVWTRHAMGEGLAERLAIEQCIQEGNSVDNAYSQIQLLRRFGHTEAAEAMEWLTADETQHAAIGNRWLLRLCGEQRDKYEAVLKTANEKIQFPLSPVNRDLRELGGYPAWYVDALEREIEMRRKAATAS